MLHGADYNPEQWAATPEIWDEDMRLMKLAGCNIMSVGIFAWASLEPSEGVYNFSWLDAIMDKLAANGAYACLATPSAARPAWLAQKYPQIMSVNADGVRHSFGGRANHCYTSPIYREKTAKINAMLAERYKAHPALALWHVSNEYGGECYCELCKAEFIKWLKNKYSNDLDELNFQYWARFWSHNYSDWRQIEPPSQNGVSALHGLSLDWRRFASDRAIDFLKAEIAPLREFTPGMPVTTNYHLFGRERNIIDYFKMAEELDVISWDSYPEWHGESDCLLAARTAFIHDLNRSFKGGKPFMLMESTPSLVNWKDTNKLKRPNMHMLSSLQAVAHGSDTVQYFQWRKGRGGSEKFHGAVVGHCGGENSRVFKDVANVGANLKKLGEIVGASTEAEVAIIYDWENLWALSGLCGLRTDKRDFDEECERYYKPFWDMGISCDIIDSGRGFAKYKLIAIPTLYMLKPNVAARLEQFVESGGTIIMTYFSGIVNENDLCFINQRPLDKLLGISAEEIDSLHDGESIGVRLGDGRRFAAECYCERIHANSATVLAEFEDDMFKGGAALTVNNFGAGKAYYVAFRSDDSFKTELCGNIARQLCLKRNIDARLPSGVTAQARTDGENKYVFLQNYNNSDREIELDSGIYRDMLSGEAVKERVKLEAFGVRVLKLGN
jgi:beta-galactosidase